MMVAEKKSTKQVGAEGTALRERMRLYKGVRRKGQVLKSPGKDLDLTQQGSPHRESKR